MNQHEQYWRTWLIEQLASVTGRRIGAAEVDRPLREFGVSSRDAVAIAASASELAGRPLPSTLVWTAPTVAELARAIATGEDPAPDGVPATGRFSPPTEPRPGDEIAIVGLACRFPGAASSGEFWRLLTEGRDAIGEAPAGRWEQFAPDLAEHDVPRHGGFLDDVAAFDAEYFGISPDEATLLDPQQRLLLEVTWEALANAGIPAGELRGTDCGVFVGLSATEYAQLTMTDLSRVDAFSATGAAASVTANRVSFALGVHGPSVTVDTACSSSLVAVHHAVRALAAGDATSAVVGGVNLLLSPAITASFARAGVLAADGRCKPFDAAADGIVRGEGCGVVVLKRLADAQADGDRVLAVIRGSAVNSDGRSNGLTAPNPVAQQRLLARAYELAGVRARSVDYVEAHGTGTLLGDPIEAESLAAVLGAGRRERTPLLLGSVKSNLGHLEGAAGIAGLIKTTLSLWHGQLPPSLNYREPNPHIDFDAGRLAVVADNAEWPRYAGVARAGVSAFGFGGTNAHVVVEEPPRAAERRQHAQGDELVVLAERSPERLRARADAVADWVDKHGDRGTRVLAAALAHGTGDDRARAVVIAHDQVRLTERLRELAAGRPNPGVVTAHGPAVSADPVFVFSGQGSQWPGMGRRLLAEEPAFAAAVEDLDVVFGDNAGLLLSQLVAADLSQASLTRQQLALFGMQVALAELWRAHGITPAAVLGHSVGEVAAAVVSGALTVADGVRVMLHRTAALDQVRAAGGGAMAVVELSADEVNALAERFVGVTVAVYSAPDQCTVSGPAEQVAALVAYVEERGGLAKVIRSAGGAGHSAAVEPFLPDLTTGLTALTPRQPQVAAYSSVLPDPRQHAGYDAGYWAANVRRPVRFTQAISAALDDGHRLFVEVSPHPVAAVAAERTAMSRDVEDLTVVPSLRRDPDGSGHGFTGALATLYAHGRPGLARERYPERVVLDLPGPVWQHRRYWADGVVSGLEQAPAAPLPPAELAYQGEWVLDDEPVSFACAAARTWAVVYADGADPGPLITRLRAEGANTTPVPLAQAHLLPVAEKLAGIVVLAGDGGSPADVGRAQELLLGVASVVRMLTGASANPPRLWLLTRDAIAVHEDETGHPGLAALRGLVRVLAFEHPELRATLVDVDAESASVVEELLADRPEDEVAWRGGHRLTHTLTRAPLSGDREPLVRDGAYLISGGLGGLGLAAARWLAESGATRLVLSARRAPDLGARAAIAEITAMGVQVEVVNGDIADVGVADAMVRAAGDAPVRGVLHAAGVLSDGSVLTMTADDVDAVWRAKTTGALRLHEACARYDLDFWLAYTSVAGMFGSPGQAAYATANAWLDAFAAWQRAQDVPAITVQWGPWAEIGGAAGTDNPVLEPMAPAEGMAALSAVLANGREHTAITRLNAGAVLELFPRLADRPFFALLAEQAGPAGESTMRELIAGDPHAARERVREHLMSLVGDMMWQDPGKLDPHAPLTSLGLDSLLAMRARGAVERDFGVTLQLPMLLRGASLSELADHLVDEVAGTQDSRQGTQDSRQGAQDSRQGGPGSRDIAERWVARLLWQAVGMTEPPVHTPLQLDADAAERLRHAVATDLGRPVTAAELFAVPTVAGMADAVRTDLVGSGDGPMRLLSGTPHGARPLFLFHAAGSPTAVYRPLVEMLPAGLTCFGLERLDDASTVRDKAARYVRMIRDQQPHGPYRLGGWSMGGMLAHEAARQLTAAGEEISLLFLIDTIIPLPDSDTAAASLRGRMRRFIGYIEQTYQVDLGLGDDDALMAMPEQDRHELVLRRLTERVSGMGEAVLEHQQTSYLDARVAEEHAVGEYHGPVLLFRAKDPHPLTTTLDPRYLRTDDALGWDEFCSQLEVVKVPGDHITVIDPPHVSVVADRIHHELSKVEQKK